MCVLIYSSLMIILKRTARYSYTFSTTKHKTHSNTHIMEALLKYENSEVQRTVHGYKQNDEFQRTV
jgi:hypothetical protein